MSDLFKLLIVGIYLFLVYKFKNNTKLLLLFTLATILILCNINKISEGYSDGSVEQYSPAKFGDANNFSGKFNVNGEDPVKETQIPKNDIKTSKNKSVSEMVNNITIPKSLFTDYQMGPFDNLVLTTGNPKSEYLKLMTDDLSKSGDMCVYQGNENPLKCKKTTGLNMGPPVDGVMGSPQSMFMFANNKSSPDCCPSTFSTSTGCVCTTEDQRRFVASNRGMVSNTSKASKASKAPKVSKR